MTEPHSQPSHLPQADVAKLINTIEEKNMYSKNRVLQNRLISGDETNVSKKLGPLVPPKPLKKSNTPEIPQSCIVKQTCEPLYSQRLQSMDGGNNYSTVEFSKQPLLLRKQKIYNTQKHLGAGSTVASDTLSKVTLDNPAILEQQLEVLEHHKKQLEELGKLNEDFSNTNKSMSLNYHRPKLSSASLLADVASIPHNSHAIYANSMHSKKIPTVDTNLKNNQYSNNRIPTSSINNIYSNVAYDKGDQRNQVFQGDQQTTLNKSTTEASSSDDKKQLFIHNGSLITEEETPQPPSPVSSSYSELRRATEVFKANNVSNQNNPICDEIVSKPIVGYEMTHDNKLLRASNNSRQFYLNKPYLANEAYSNYKVTVPAKGTLNSSDYYGYGGFSQTSSNYDSIYEPINPRPTSQMSARSHNLMYPTTCINNANTGVSTLPECSAPLGKSSSCNLSTFSNLSEASSRGSNSSFYPNNSSGGRSSNNYQPNHKESEVESLADYLVKSIDIQRDQENYGICFKCNERVVGENSGCTAMDQIYHIVCFTCSQCQINLQGKPFYVLDCTPYCEFDYLQTLEKCSVCMKPILERILRATGKPYHPQCFTCVACKKSLDGIPFTVDATNQNYCIEDFHKKFAPRCCVCKEPIMPEPGEDETVRVVALDRSFHFECYKCEDCGLLLSSEPEGRGCYPLDDHVLCKSCNAKRVQMLTNRITTTEL